MVNEIDNAIKCVQGMANGCLALFSGNNGNTNKNMNIRNVNQPMNSTVQTSNNGIKFSDAGPHNTRLSPVVHDSNPVVNGIKFSSD